MPWAISEATMASAVVVLSIRGALVLGLRQMCRSDWRCRGEGCFHFAAGQLIPPHNFWLVMPRESGASSTPSRCHTRWLLDRPLSRTMILFVVPEANLMHRYRTHTCGALRADNIGSTVRLSGWCHRIRDHGGLLFIDLRDHYGLTQIVADPDSPAFKTVEKLRAEWVIRVDGRVRARPAGTDNPDLPTGAVEVFATDIEVLGPAGELPMPVFGDQEYPEEIRLKYRFLDLRRERLHRNIIKRGKIIDSLRRRMKEQGFFEFQTPILTASSPEGARDFLVPSRLHPGKFYALPQAPQQFKQLTMIAGFDRYFQIAPCFRDEDARADRSPGEFYQLDVEMSFVTQDDVFAAVEPVLRGVFKKFSGGKPVTQKFPRIK